MSFLLLANVDSVADIDCDCEDMALSPVVANKSMSYLQQARSSVARLRSGSKPKYDGLYLDWTTIIHGSSNVAPDHNNTEHGQFSMFNYGIVNQSFFSREEENLTVQAV